MTAKRTTIQSVARLLEIMARLRSPDGCPWDAEQTPESLKLYLLEETYEVMEAIDLGEPSAILDELGDLLLQVVFQARIFEERGVFDFGDIASAIADKLVRRHPHVFGGLETRNRESLDTLWNEIKNREKMGKGKRVTDLGGVPRNMPSLLRARKLAEKAIRRGDETILPMVREALNAYEKAGRSGNRKCLEEAFGNLLFAMVNMGRMMDIDAEEALRMTLNRFTRQHDQIIEGMPEA